MDDLTWFWVETSSVVNFLNIRGLLGWHGLLITPTSAPEHQCKRSFCRQSGCCARQAFCCP